MFEGRRRALICLWTGVVLVGAGTCGVLTVLRSARAAVSMDEQFQERGDETSGTCAGVQIHKGVLNERVVSTSDTVELNVELTRDPMDQSCAAQLALQAPAFDASPSQETVPVVFGKGIQSAHVVWLLVPKSAGQHRIRLEVADSSLMLGVSVGDVLGMTPRQAKFLSLASTALGPMLTVPWWIQLFKKKPTLPSRRRSRGAKR